MSDASPSLHGLHHVTAVTSDARANLAFYTRVLGMRLVKTTVNQDDVTAYHLFYADALGSPGTELTFFEWAHVAPNRPGAGAVTETALRVGGGNAALELWRAHFDRAGITRGDIEPSAGEHNLPSLPFQDPEGQRLRLIAEPASAEESGSHPWQGSPVSRGASVVGLAEVTLTVRDPGPTARFLTETLGFRVNANDAALYETGERGGPGARLRLLAGATPGAPGAGGVHHVAWAVTDPAAQRAWLQHLARHGVHNSGLVDRFYFQSVYFRVPGGILFELATNGPGFTADGEALERLGEKLSLPPFLEGRRAAIEAGLRPLR